MGKSKYDKLTYTAKLAADKRMAEQVNIDLSQYGNTERPGASYSGKKSWDQLSTDVAEAYSNDYDVRETVKAAQASGNKKAQKLGQGISNASEAYDAQRFMEQTHKNRMGNTGNYDGANDQGNVAKYWTNKLHEGYASKDDLNGMRADLEDNPAVEAEERNQTYTYESSDKVAKAQERLDKYKIEIGKGNIFGDLNADPPRADDQKDAASSFASDYSSGVKAGSNLKENKARNLNNAIGTVTGSYRDQFM